MNGDGEFDDTLGIAEEYNVLLYVSAPPSACELPGDSNCDGAVNSFDIDPFVIALTAGQAGWEDLFDCDYYCANPNIPL